MFFNIASCERRLVNHGSAGEERGAFRGKKACHVTCQFDHLVHTFFAQRLVLRQKIGNDDEEPQEVIYAVTRRQWTLRRFIPQRPQLLTLLPVKHEAPEARIEEVAKSVHVAPHLRIALTLSLEQSQNTTHRVRRLWPCVQPPSDFDALPVLHKPLLQARVNDQASVRSIFPRDRAVGERSLQRWVEYVLRYVGGRVDRLWY